MPKIYSIKEIFSIDLRSLALFRVLIGFLAMLDGLNRLGVAEAHYSDTGVVPRAAYLTEIASSSDFSLNLINGDWRFQAFLILLQVACAFLVMIGYRSRLFAFFTYVLLASFHTRIPINTHGGDAVLRIMFFWLSFLPAGALFSVDAANSTKPQQLPLAVSGFAPAAALLQLTYVYFFSFIMKWHPIWHSEFSALYYALNVDHLVSSTGKWLLNFPNFLKVSTAATMVMEGAGPLLVFSPIFLPQLRMLMAAVFISFHFGLFMGMYLGIFPWVCAISWTLFLPAEFWTHLARRVAFRPSFAVLAKYFPARPVSFAISRRTQATAAFFLVLVTWWNLWKVEAVPEVPQPFNNLMYSMYINQKWNLFAPYPFKDDGWFIVEGILKNGEHINLMNSDQPLTDAKPGLVAETYVNSQWRKYFMSLWFEDNEKYFLNYGRYLCRTHNGSHADAEQLETAKVYYMLEMTPPPGEPVAAPEKKLLWEHYCFAKRPSRSKGR